MAELKTIKIPCPNGHETVMMTAAQLVEVNPEIYLDGIACDRCKNEATSCAHCPRCMIDVCSACLDQIARHELTCPAGHTLVPTTHEKLIEEDYLGYYRGYQCNEQESIVRRCDTSFPVYHCTECHYDLCPKDVAKKLGYQKDPEPRTSRSSGQAPKSYK